MQSRFVALCVVVAAAVIGSGSVSVNGVWARDKLMDLDNPHLLLDNERDLWFGSLSEAELQEKWSHDDGTSVAHKLQALSRRYDGSVYVDVRLVGFTGGDGGNMELSVSEHDLLKYLDVAAGSVSADAVPHVLNIKPGQSHDLSLRVKHVFRVTKASAALTHAIASAVTDHIHPTKAEMDVRVPVSAVDDLIRADYHKHAMGGYTLYLLNPPQPKRMMSNLPPNKDGTLPPDAEQRAVPIRYTYMAGGAAAQSAAGGASGSGPASCPSVVWVGTGAADRYAWIDLTAGPISYGPQTSGDGIVTEFSLPRPDRKLFLPHSGARHSLKAMDKKFAHDTRPADVSIHGTPHDPARPPMTDPVVPAATTSAAAPLPPKPKALTHVEKHTRSQELLAELAAVVRKSVRALVAPAIDRFPVLYTRKITINLVVVHDRPNVPDDPQHSWAAWDARWAAARDQLTALALVGQEISVVTHHVVFEECELCVAAYTHSLKSHTSNTMTADASLRTTVHRYLDSTDMRDWLEHFENKFWGIKEDAAREQGTDPNTGARLSVRAVTAFVYDIATTDILLLDRFHQALSFSDMVIAVQTRAPAAVVDFSCGGKPLQFDPRDVTRPLLAALLQTTWGVAPTDSYWNPHALETEKDYLWSTSATPFGYFSTAKTLAFPQRDAVARHVLYSDLNHTITEVGDLFAHFTSHGREIEEILSAAEHVTFLRRWNVFTYKLERAHHFLSLPNFNQSLFYVRSSHHDLDALHDIVHAALRHLTPTVVCKTVAPPTAFGERLQTAVSFAVIVALPVLAFVVTSQWFWSLPAVRRYTQRRKHHD